MLPEELPASSDVLSTASVLPWPQREAATSIKERERERERERVSERERDRDKKKREGERERDRESRVAASRLQVLRRLWGVL